MTLWTVSLQAPLSMEFSKEEYWSVLPCLTPGDLPNPGIKLTSLMSLALASGFFTTSARWEAPYVASVYLTYLCEEPISRTYHQHFPGGSDGKEPACNVGDLGLIPGLVRSPGGGHGNPI